MYLRTFVFQLFSFFRGDDSFFSVVITTAVRIQAYGVVVTNNETYTPKIVEYTPAHGPDKWLRIEQTK